MKKEVVLSNCMFKEVVKKGAMFDNDQMVVPVEYDHVSRAKKNLFVATKGSVNAFRTYGLEATFDENGKPYGKYFNEHLKNKVLDTDVHFYTIDGQIHMDERILACLACINDDMIVLLKSDYTWSIALIDYENLTITDIDEYSGFEKLKSDYFNRRFIVTKENESSVISFNCNSEVEMTASLSRYEPVSFNDDGMVIKEDGKYGFMNYEGETILTCTWDYIRLHKNYIEAVWNNRTAIYLYNGYCVWYEDVKSYETLWVKGILLFKVHYKNGCCSLYSSKKQLLPKDTESLEILSDGTAIIALPAVGYSLVSYDIQNDEFISVLPSKCIDDKAKHFDSMNFLFRKDATIVEVIRGNKIAYYNTDGSQITKFKYCI